MYCIFCDIRFDFDRRETYISAMTRALGIDYGRRRIGVACSDPDRIIVSRTETILTRGFNDTVRKLIGFILKNEIGEIVIGYPYRQDGTPGPLAAEIERLSEQLQIRFPNIPVERLDERYTSLLAQRYIHQSGGKVGDNKGRVDSKAAAILLDEYLSRKRERR